ncbi:MAG: DNA mismatch repair protein MutS [Robiginitalea sp.]
MMKFRVGDRVQLLDELTSGEVLEVLTDDLRLLTEEGFEMLVRRDSVVLVPEGSSLTGPNIDWSDALKEADKPRKKSPGKYGKTRYAPPMEVDLHIEKLVSSTRGMTTFDILNHQLDTARRQLEFALRKRIQRLVFIHGVGEGVLRAELRTLIRRYDGLQVHDADPVKYGMGATEVYIPQSAFD